jgi:pilus assembly protein FimV
LEKLKSIVLSIDWEITDACLTDLLTETDSLMPRFKADRLTQTLLRMLNSLGRYIQKKKASAHPDAIKRIMSVYRSLEKVCDPHQETDIKSKEQAIAREIVAFKKLKQQVDSRTKKALPARTKARGPAETATARQSTGQEIEKRPTSEIQHLKEQLANLQKEFDAFRNA